MRIERTAPVFLLGALTVLAGCNPQDAGSLSHDTRKLAAHTGEALGNASVAGRVNTVLALRKGVDVSGLHVEAKGGVVTVGGHVRNEEERRRVIQTVNDTRGVEKVVDRLRVQQ